MLPVVARKKGLNDQYEKADGGPQPKKVDNTIAPVLALASFNHQVTDTFVPQAPGTFGFDHSKYRPPRDGDQSIPMDEFGRQEDPVDDEYEKTGDKFEEQTLADESRSPKWRGSPPSPAPFSQYAPPRDKTTILPANPVNPEVGRIPQHMEEEKGAGCCAGCVVM